MAPRPLVTSPEVAAFLNVSHSALRKWRMNNYGPPSYTFGTAIRYDMAEVRAWSKQQRATPVEPAVETISVDRFAEIAQHLSWIQRLGEEHVGETAQRLQDCTHSSWSPGMPGGEGELSCDSCGLTADLAVALQITAVLMPCGHELEDAEDWSMLAHHVDAVELGEGSFWSCSTEMPDWNTDEQDDPAQAA